MTPNGQLCYHDLTEVLLKHNSEMSVNDLISPFFRFSLYGSYIYSCAFTMCIPLLKNKGECNLNIIH